MESFLKDVLKADYNSGLIKSLVTSEASLLNIKPNASTYAADDFRDEKYRTEASRWKLRARIVNELFSKKRLEDDNQIKINKGGALPTSAIQRNRQAFILTGLPASGKSSRANEISEHFGAVILDSDFVKRKLPEYKNMPSGASVVHQESDAIIFGFPDNMSQTFLPLVEFCSREGINIVIPKVGHQAPDIARLSELLTKLNYNTHLTLVSLDRKEAALRSLNRYKETKRYVPLSLIFDGYSNDPILTYYRLKNHFKEKFVSFGKISMNIALGQKPLFIEGDEGNPSLLYK